MFTRCVTGNLAEVVLTPTFSQPSSIFACHVQPVPRYPIYDIEYTVMYKDEAVNKRKLRATKLYDGQHPERAVDQ